MRYLACGLFQSPAANSRSRAICVHERLRTGVIGVTPRRSSSSSDTGGNPAVPSKEFTSARFSARNRSTSCSKSRTYRLRATRANQVIIECHIGLSRTGFSLSVFDFVKCDTRSPHQFPTKPVSDPKIISDFKLSSPSAEVNRRQAKARPTKDGLPVRWGYTKVKIYSVCGLQPAGTAVTGKGGQSWARHRAVAPAHTTNPSPN
jgi:hypothetical protein